MAAQVARAQRSALRGSGGRENNNNSIGLSDTAASGQIEQQQQQQQWRPFVNMATSNHQAKIPEKRMQELRLLAYEYVKQIVARANELSSSREATGGEWQDQITDNNDGGHHHHQHNQQQHSQPGAAPCILIDSSSRRLVNEAASQINKRFRFLDTPPSAGKSVTYQQNNSTPTPGVGGPQRPSSFTKKAQPPATTTTTKTTTAITSSAEVPTMATRGAGDYIEQDYATMSSSQDENESRGGAGGRADNQTPRGRGHTKPPHRQGNFAHHCLNWHLIVSCFSTCLPEALRRHTMGAAQASAPGPSAV